MAQEIAIVGMAGRFPEAEDYNSYWKNLVSGVNSIKEIPRERWDINQYYSPQIEANNKSISKWCGIIDRAEYFDNAFFSISPREAKNMDPQQRLLLEETWHCIEDSGISLRALKMNKTSVYVGVMTGDYRQKITGMEYDVDSYASLGNYEGMLANRLSYVLGMTGISSVINAACASSLVAIHEAKKALQNGECSYAIAGGVNLNLHPWKYISFSKSRMLSPTGQCKTFDKDADGYVPGEGVGVLLLQPLDSALREGNHIYGLIKGSGVNHGGRGLSITAPSVKAQKEVILAAYSDAEISPESVTYWEAHGTGTSLGDPIEIEAASQAVREYTRKIGYCSIGSVKTNIGHLEAAAGIASVIKVLQMMKHGLIPGMLNLQHINPLINFSRTPFVPVQKLTNWTRLAPYDPLRASVSSFGFGGVNSHLILEEYIKNPDLKSKGNDNIPEIFTISASNEEGLKRQIAKWETFVASDECANSSLTNICRTQLLGRQHDSFRNRKWVRNKKEISSFLKVAAQTANTIYSKPWALKIGEIIFCGYQDLNGWETEKKQLKELLNFVGGHALWRRFQMHPWPEKYSIVFSALVGCKWIEKLQKSGLKVDLIAGEGNGFYISLVISGMMSELQLAMMLNNNFTVSAESLARPSLTFLDPINGEQFQPYSVDTEYVQMLFQEGLSCMPIDFNDVMAKARVLFESQHTFLNFLLEWDSILKQQRILVSELLYSDQLRDKEQKLIYIIIQFALRKVNRKWSLQVSGYQEYSQTEELVTLIAEEFLSKETVVALILSDEPDWDEAVLQLQSRQSLLAGKKLKLMQERSKGLTEVPDINRWLREAESGIIPQIHQSYSVLQIGCLKERSDSLIQEQIIVCKPNVNFQYSIEEILADLWIYGVDIDWSQVYPENSYLKAVLPKYEFDRKLFRLEPVRSIIDLDIEQKKSYSTQTGEGGDPDMDDIQDNRLFQEIVSFIKAILADKLDIRLEELRGDIRFETYGVDSFVIHEFNRQLELTVGSLPKTLLFEYDNIDSLSRYLADSHQEKFTRFLIDEAPEHQRNQSKVETVMKETTCPPSNAAVLPEQAEQTNDIAIIGLSGRYPGADHLDSFWELLCQGRDMVTEIPIDRWDWRQYYDPDPSKSAQGKSYSKWGAFLKDVDKFDPLFFGISPADAETIDPQERLFLETAWATLEDAGYTPEELRATIHQKGRADVGVFVGATTFSYSLWGPELWNKTQQDGETVIPTSLPWSIANRISFLLNFYGPSMTVDTACSASLTAIHLACESVLRKECSVALVGGVNLYLHPSKYVWLSQMRMLSPSGKCHSFGAASDGFVPGEGTGAILIKPLMEAIQDGDRIYGVIKATSINHGGRTNGYTVPNPNSQADLVSTALTKANVNPRSISYIEAHGTGTALGDPIEVAGLAKVYGKTFERNSCAIGSVKSNIGHLEAAAGIAGLTKILLQMKHRQLVPSLHAEELNPNISFEDTPFFVQRGLTEWQSNDLERHEPLRAGISSFGAGGSNAHILIEEYVEPSSSNNSATYEEQENPCLVVLSASTEERLNVYASHLLEHLKKHSLNVSNVAFTLQVGRQALEHRLALIVRSREELVHKLEDFINPNEKKRIDSLFTGVALRPKADNVKFDILKKEDKTSLINIAEKWVKGGDIDWKQLIGDQVPCKVSLPTYPFARERYWIQGIDSVNVHPSSSNKYKAVFNLVSEEEGEYSNSDIVNRTFSTTVFGNEHFISDHYVGKRKILPGVAYVEMAREASEKIGKGIVSKIKQIVFMSPIIIEESPIQLWISIQEESGTLKFFIYTIPTVDGKVIHGQGEIELVDKPVEAPPAVDIQQIKNRCNITYLNKRDVYRHLHQIELNLLESFQTIEHLAIGEEEAIALVELPHHMLNDFNPYTLQPVLMDGALQVPPAGRMRGEEQMIHLPYTISEISLYRPLTQKLYSHTKLAKSKSGRQQAMSRFDVNLLDEAGQVLVIVKGFLARPVKPDEFLVNETEIAKVSEITYYEPMWVQEELKTKHLPPSAPGNWLLFSQNEVVGHAIQKQRTCILVTPGTYFEQAGSQHFRINPQNPEDYGKLLDHIPWVPSLIVFDWGETELVADEIRIQEQLDKSVYSIIYLMQHITKQKMKEEIRYLYLYREDKNEIEPVFSALSGLMKTLYLENPRIHGCTLAVSKEVNIINALESECRLKEKAGTKIKYADGKRLIQQFKTVEFNNRFSFTSEFPGIRPNGVYLLTGGLGGLGRLFAEELSIQAKNTTIILTGRTPENEDNLILMNQLRSRGVNLHYLPADISDRNEVFQLVSKVKQRFGRIHGVLHGAGVIRDTYYYRKTAAMIREVIAPKLFGAVWLDELLSQEDLDYFILFSSTSAVLGNYGQADYAFANHFLDTFAEWREKKRLSGERKGKTLSLNWPLWQAGGMHVDEQTEEQLYRQFGMRPMSTSMGLKTFVRSLNFEGAQLMVMEGNPLVTNDILQVTKTEQINVEHEQSEVVEELHQVIGSSAWIHKLEQSVIQMVSQLLKIPANRIQSGRELSSYGFDSVRFVEFANTINKAFSIKVTPADFFEYPTISDFIGYLSEEFADNLITLFGRPDNTNVSTTTEPRVHSTGSSSAGEAQSKVEVRGNHATTKEPIAIIGMHGVLPQSEDLAQFWKHLINGSDLITEVPADRWDYKEYLGDPQKGNKTNSKWGGFIPDIDKFDAKFFGISPREAEIMDPQQRILLETVWKTIEDAGYKVSDLSKFKTGLYVGASTNDYMELLKENGGDVQAYTTTGNFHSILVNRISYLLNLNGPSFPIDTACSSSLVAVRQAVEGLWNGSCQTAIVAGVNALLSPTIYISFAKAGMLNSEGRCKTFDQSANGYVRAEGVGAILLKPLSEAEAAGDHIYAVIRGTSVNHGGKVSTLTTPNPNAQAQLIIDAFEESEIDPRSVTYIEAHGTGTSLGDPIEVNGLKRAFKEIAKRQNIVLPKKAYCGIGSVKTNIGHLEPAAGISGLFKVLLAMKYKTLPANLHMHEINPYLQLEDSPFYLVNETRHWNALKDSQNRTMPRRAGVSSFGFGGVNAHVLLEEYQEIGQQDDVVKGPGLFVLSARNIGRLREYASKMLAHVEEILNLSKNQLTISSTEVVRRELIKMISEEMHLEETEVLCDEPLSEYGFELIHFSSLLARINSRYKVNWDHSHMRDYSTLDLMAAQISTLKSEPTGKLHEGSMHDLLYTLQVGREEMDERLAIVVDGYDDLAEKLSQYLKGEESSEFVFTGVSEGESSKGMHLILDGREGRQFLEVLLEDRNWSKLARLWVSGISIDWSVLYPGSRPKRISVPTYPFSKDRFWFRAVETKQRGSAKLLHLPQVIVNPLDAKLDLTASLKNGLTFNFQLKADDPIFKDHIVGGKSIFPGVGIFEMARSALSILIPDSIPILEEVTWLQPLPAEDISNLHFILSEERIGCYRFSLQQSTTTGSVKYVSGYVSKQENVKVQVPGKNIQEMIPLYDKNFTQKEFYALLSDRGLQYGPYFQGVSDFWMSEAESIAKIQLPQSYINERDTLLFQPSLMDSALQTIAGMILADEKNAASVTVPFSVGKVEWYASLSEMCYVYTQRLDNESYDVSIVNSNGQICVALKRLVIKHLNVKSDKTIPINDFLYEVVWEPKVLLSSQKKEIAYGNGQTILLVTKPGLETWSDEIRDLQHSGDIYEIEIGQQTVRINDKKWAVQGDDMTSWRDCLTQIPKASMVCYLAAIQPEAVLVDIDSVLETKQIIIPMFNMFKALSEVDWIHKNMDMYVITNNTVNIHPEEKIQPFGAGLHGFVMSAAKEYPQLAIRGMDVCVKEPVSNLLKAIFEEPPHPSGEFVVIRNGNRYVQGFKKSNLPVATQSPFKLNGVYLIIGGAGGIGLAISQDLAKTVQGKVILVGRSELNDIQKREIARINSLGGTVMYETADVSNLADMERVKRSVIDRFGKINGVIHAAMVLRDRILERMDENAFRAVLTPKVEGSIVLHQIFHNENLDFLIFFSSAQSFTGSRGQSNYSAASTFMDAYARYIDQEEIYPVYTLNWGYWGEVGVVATDEYRDRLSTQGIYAIGTEEGITAMNCILFHGARHMLALKASEAFIDDLKGGILSTENTDGVQAFVDLESYANLLLLHKFQEKGWLRAAGEHVNLDRMKSQWGITPEYERLLQTMLSRLEHAGFLSYNGLNYVSTRRVEERPIRHSLLTLETTSLELERTYSQIRPHLRLLKVCMDNLDTVIQGHTLATEIIFPGSSMDLVEGIYKGSYYVDECNRLVANTVLDYLLNRSQKGFKDTVNILEIGAGTGGTSEIVLNAIKAYAPHIHYVYTDISKGFTQYGSRRFGTQYPFMSFQTLSINNEPEPQGYEQEQFDIILAANVMHATSDITNALSHTKKLMKPNGLLILNEVTEVQTFHTLTFGLLKGWWLYKDQQKRLPGSPLLHTNMWKQVLSDLNFDSFTVLGKTTLKHQPQQVMTARKLKNRNQAAAEVPFLPNKDDRYSESEIQQKLSAILSSLLGTDISEIRPSSAFSSYGVDSIIGVEFINALNDEFSIRLRTLIIFEYSNIISLSRFLYEKLLKTNVQESAAAVENEIYVDPQPIVGHTSFTESLEDQRADSLKLKTEAVADILINQLAVSLGTEPSSIDRKKTFSEYGVDSIVGVELINLINETFQLSMKTITIFDYSNVNALAQYIAVKVGEIKKGPERTNREDYVLDLLDKLESNELSLVEISNLLGGSS